MTDYKFKKTIAARSQHKNRERRGGIAKKTYLLFERVSQQEK